MLAALAVGRADSNADNAESVVVLHGLARSSGAMKFLAARLSAAGFDVYNLDYPSTEKGPEELVAELGRQVQQCCSDAPRLHFVGHSLGAVLTRALLAEQTPENLGRVVMLAPPNQGSEIVDSLANSAAFGWALGPTAPQLGTDPESLPNRLPPPDYELGVIAGVESVNPVGSSILPGEDDGTVSVERAKLPGMTDFVTVPYSHTFIMRAEEVADLTIHFLRYGRFGDVSASERP